MSELQIEAEIERKKTLLCQHDGEITFHGDGNGPICSLCKEPVQYVSIAQTKNVFGLMRKCREYMQHKAGCKMNIANRAERRAGKVECNCGLDAVVANIK